MLNVYMKSKSGKYNARAIYEDGKIKVLKGSQLKAMTNGNYNRNKQVVAYRNDKKIVGKNLVLLQDVEFNSPSTAAQFIVDSSRNGWKDWKT